MGPKKREIEWAALGDSKRSSLHSSGHWTLDSSQTGLSTSIAITNEFPPLVEGRGANARLPTSEPSYLYSQLIHPRPFWSSPRGQEKLTQISQQRYAKPTPPSLWHS